MLIPTEFSLSISMESWLALWHMFCNINTVITAKYLAYIGYTQFIAEAFTVTRPKNIFSKSKQSFFNCYVIGASASGKTVLLKSLIKQINDG